jgi:hypothetical protein
MDLLDKIDLVLACLYPGNEHHPTLHYLHEKLKDKGINPEEIKDCLLKLHRDGFIRYEFEGGFVDFYHDLARFIISFEGKYFYETYGSYKKKLALDNADGNRLKVLTVWVAVGTILVGLASLLAAAHYLRALVQG